MHRLACSQKQQQDHCDDENAVLDKDMHVQHDVQKLSCHTPHGKLPLMRRSDSAFLDMRAETKPQQQYSMHSQACPAW